MLSIFWNPFVFHLIKVFLDDVKFNEGYFFNELLVPFSDLMMWCEEELGRKFFFYFDNIRPHIAKKVDDYIYSHGNMRSCSFKLQSF